MLECKDCLWQNVCGAWDVPSVFSNQIWSFHHAHSDSSVTCLHKVIHTLTQWSCLSSKPTDRLNPSTSVHEVTAMMDHVLRPYWVTWSCHMRDFCLIWKRWMSWRRLVFYNFYSALSSNLVLTNEQTWQTNWTAIKRHWEWPWVNTVCS